MEDRGRPRCCFLRLLAAAAATLLAAAKEAEGQDVALGDDAACLRGFKSSMADPGSRLSRWTSVQIASPCNASAGPGDGIVCNNGRIFSISLNASGLSGTIPSSLANCIYVQTLDLSSNSLSGSIPSVLGTLAYLTSINFSDNRLTSSIPAEMSSCIYLNVLDLHRNQLNGPIPGQLGLLSRLRVFDVSYNQLSGLIPSTLSNFTSTGAPRFNVSSFLGNKNLYGFPLPLRRSHGPSVSAIVGVGVGSGFLSLVLSFTAVCIWLRATSRGYAAEEGKLSQLAFDS